MREAVAHRVALLFECTNAYARAQLLGIGDFIAKEANWRVTLADLGAKDGPPVRLKDWEGDGVILRGENRQLAEAVERLGLPCVDLTPSRLLPKAPWVKADDAAIAELAAGHFLDKGFGHFGYCGDLRFPWAKARGKLFAEALRRAGKGCSHFSPKAVPEDSHAVVEETAAWLRELPKPAAVFACYDNRGQQVLEACRRAGLRVPEDVAVLGVDNDEVLCLLSPPPLSSIALNPRRAGWEAAALLAHMLSGHRVAASKREQLIAPVGIITRKSTDILAVEDARIVPALRFIREHACRGIRVDEVLRHSPMSRRTLETQFRKLLGRSPHEEIQRVRIERAKDLLVKTELPIWEVAEKVALNPEHLSVLFRRELGLSPRAYRQRFGSSLR